MPDAQGNLTPEEELEAQFTPEVDEAAEAAQAAADAAEAAAASEGTPPPKIKVGDNEYDQAEVQSLLEFQEWARQNQDKMGNFAAYLRGDAEFTPKQAPKTPEGEGGEEDPFASIEDEALREKLRHQQEEIDQLRDVTTRSVTAANLDEANRAVNKAYEEIKDKYGLTEQEVEELATATAASGILPGIRANTPDAREAAVKALESTYWSTPAYRDKAIHDEITRLSEHERRKGLAGSIGGNSGSLSRELPSDEEVAKMTPADRRDAMAKEIAASLRGNT